MAPSKSQIDAWGHIGNSGWSWEALKPYYKKAHTLALPSEAVRDHMHINYIDDEVRGRSGPIQVSFPEDNNLISKAWIETFETLGYNLTTDPFSGEALGGFGNSLTLDPKTKTRSYSTQYYKAAQGRPNLHVETGVEAHKILLKGEGENVVAHGVEYAQNGEIKTVQARLEVIVAAGAFNSPRLLELSGIGNAKHLQSLGIEVKVDNPFVGENLQDHLMTGISYELPDQLPEGVSTMDSLRRGEPEAIQAAMQAYKTNGSGPLSVGAVMCYSYMGLVDLVKEPGQTKLKQLLDEHLGGEQKDFPSQKFQYDHIRAILENPKEGTASYFLTPTQGSWGNGALLPGNWFTLGAAFLTPFSRGNIHIASADPTKKAILDPKYLSHPLDIEFHARHLQYLNTITKTQPLAGFLKPGGKRGPEIAEKTEDLDAAKAYLQKTVLSNWHSTSTCAMMPRELGGVVDSRLIVYGTKNVRVVDSSIMPMIVRANTQSTVYAVAERAADFIKQDHALV